jgi:hypothetical protein
MTTRKKRLVAAAVLILVIFTAVIAAAGHFLSGRMEAAVALLPCPAGHVRTSIQEAGSCLGDYRNRKANEPIAFCVRTRSACVART